MSEINESGLPLNQKLWRVRVRMESEGGEMKDYDSILLSSSQANSAAIDHRAFGRNASVIIDQEAARKYYADHPNAKGKKGRR